MKSCQLRRGRIVKVEGIRGHRFEGARERWCNWLALKESCVYGGEIDSVRVEFGQEVQIE